MKLPVSLFVVAASMCLPGTALADASDNVRRPARTHSGNELPIYLQCVPYARALSGIQIFGNARTWWKQAEGRYQRGNTPRKGAVMAFTPHRNMREGHVATVTKVIDSRTVLLDHANWSPINGRRGQIERNVKAIDVSSDNDWSEVRVWYHPLKALGKTPWPVKGFIYNERSGKNGPALVQKSSSSSLVTKAKQSRTHQTQGVHARGGNKPSHSFARAFGNNASPRHTGAKVSQKPGKAMTRQKPPHIASLRELTGKVPSKSTHSAAPAPSARRDVVGDIISRNR
ncbi:MAG: CHAP domain-containing protein [Sphingomonadaceae bacterium]